MRPEIDLGLARVFWGSNLDVLPTLPDNSVDSIVTDPPYELGFMGKKWDSSGIAYSVELWRECLRVLKPGGHLLAFGGSRTWHRLAVAIEDAGFEVRDSIAWLYGSGFPKSHDISKAINKAAGVEYEAKPASGVGFMNANDDGYNTTLNQLTQVGESTDEAKKWAGWGTALKPAFEPVVVARKPLIGTVAENVLQWGVGGLNIDGSRIGTETIVNPAGGIPNGANNFVGTDKVRDRSVPPTVAQGRWPANIILDEYTAELLDEQTEGKISQGHWANTKVTGFGEFGGGKSEYLGTGRKAEEVGGGASRFFYVAKASKRDRNEGLDGLETRHNGKMMRPGNNTQERASEGFERFNTQPSQNFHPTVKPTDLMRYLIKLVTPAGGIVLDPFTGSGSTGKAALLDGYQFIGIELTEEYLPIIKGRLEWAQQQKLNESAEAEKKQDERLF